MKHISKEEMMKRSKRFFDKDKKLKKMFATSDGNFFYPDEQGESFCNGHIRTNGSKNLKRYEITRAEVYPSKKKGTQSGSSKSENAKNSE